MATGMLSVGITGIQAAQMGLQVTQHNIANANTEGYSRQYIQQSAGIPRLTGSGYFGSGTTVDTVYRSYDRYLTAQTASAQTRASEYEALAAKLGQLDNMFGDASAGLAPAIQDFFRGVQTVAANPSLVSARQSMLSSSETLVNRFNALATRLGELYDSVNGEVISEVDLINNYAAQIGEINGQITRAEAATQQPPNDLLDMRDQLVAELNKHIRVSTVRDSIGNFNVFIGNGQQLVVGSVVNSLRAMNSSFDPERVVVGLQGQSGNVQELAEDLIDGGTLGGLMKFRANSLDDAANKLGMVATSMAMTFNAQHALGQDLYGANGDLSIPTGFQKDYFLISGPKVLAGSSSAATVTAAFLAPTIGSDGNFQSNLTGSDYVLRNNGTNLTLTRLSDGKIFPDPAATQVTTLAGLNSVIASEGISLAGALPTAGVDYLIEPTRGIAANLKLNSVIAADTSRIAVGAPVMTSIAQTNTGSLQVSQGQVATGYTLDNLTGAQFTFNGTAFSFPKPTGSIVSAIYSNSSTPVNISDPVPPATDSLIPIENGGGQLVSITFDGITIDLAGTPKSGDSFSITENKNGVADSRNALRLGALQTQKATEGGQATYQGSFASLVSSVGAQTRQAQVNGAAQQSLFEQNEAARSAVSGVNLDEEAANLIRYQQAYQASARALDIASKLFDTLLGITS